MFLTTPKTVNGEGWYADSGASSHVANDVGNLNQKQEYNGTKSLVVSNGEKLNIYHIGHAYLPALNNTNLLLKDILHVPSIEKNLISISQLTSYNDINVIFYSFGYVVKDKVTGQVLLQGRLKEGIYQF